MSAIFSHFGEYMQKKVEDSMEKKTNKKKIVASDIILIIAVIVFAISAYKIISMVVANHKADKEYDNIAENAIDDSQGHATIQVDFEELKGINPDVVGWIHFENPDISYPIVKGEDNAKYLKMTFEKKKNPAGSIFMDVLNNGEFADRNTFIYGHNMKNGSMFAKLLEFRNQEYYEQNPYFYIYTPDGREVTYQIFAACLVQEDSQSYTRFYNSDAEFKDYLEYEKSGALYDTGVDVNEKSQIVSLSTCTKISNSQRFLVHGVKISETKVGE